VPSKIPETDSVPVLTAEERARLQQEETMETNRRAEVTGPTNATTGTIGAGAAAAAIGVPVGIGYGLARYGPSAVQSAKNIYNRAAAPSYGSASAPIGSPTAPSAPAAPVRPVAPAGMPAPQAPAAGSGILNSANNIVRQLALSKLLPAAGNVMKGANIAGMATFSGDLGPKTPQTGRMRGMEINPLTGAPWTPEQIRQYETNPSVYDQQMAPPQFRR
jgi:hypothetical protein